MDPNLGLAPFVTQCQFLNWLIDDLTGLLVVPHVRQPASYFICETWLKAGLLATLKKDCLSEGRFELPPTEVDCDLNAAP